MKAVIYAAKSTADVRGSIPAQLKDCRAWCEREDWEVVSEHRDEGFSAYSGNRGPGLDLAKRSAVEAAELDGDAMLVVQHSDRLARGDGRSADHLAEVYFAMRRAGVRLRSVQDDSNLEDAIRAVLIGERNTEDSRRKSLATSAGIKRRAERGLHTGPRPYGYRHAADVGLEVVEHEAAIVIRIYTEFAAGRSLTAIARRLHRDGVPTARGATWRPPTVAGVLRNPVYVGKVRYRGELYTGAHEPIITAELADRARALFPGGRAKGRGRPPKGHHLFRGGVLRCSCGDPMVPRTDSRGYEFYCCNGHIQLGREHCPVGCIRRAAIDDAVYCYFEQVGLDVEATRSALAESRDRKLAEIRALRGEAERELRRAEERLARVRRDYADGEISAADWSEFRDELTGERDAAKAELERLVAQADEVEAWDELRDAEAETYRRLAEIRAVIEGRENGDHEALDTVRAALARMFERFVIRRSAERVHVELLGDGFVIEPVPRDQAIVGYSENLTPQLRREPLEQGAINERSAPVA